MPLSAPVIAAIVTTAGSAVIAENSSEQSRKTMHQQMDQQRQQAADAAAQVKPTMPTPDSNAVQDAQKASIIAQMSNRGRASTILTDTATADKLGG